MTLADMHPDRIRSLIAGLEDLLAAPAPLAAPPHVAAGELIESSWGNAVVDELAAIRAGYEQGDRNVYAALPTVTQLYNDGSFPLPQGVWSDVQLGTFVITRQTDLHILVTATIYPGSGGGECHIQTAVNGSGAGHSSKQRAPGGNHAFLVHQHKTTLGPGTYMLSVLCFSEAAGNAERLSGSVTTGQVYGW
jgi:hypothetical protein